MVAEWSREVSIKAQSLCGLLHHAPGSVQSLETLGRGSGVKHHELGFS